MAEMEWYHVLLAAGGGLLAGAINTLAGNGSVITITILTELLGLPGNVANATNRIGVVAQSFSGMGAYYQNGMLRLRRSWMVIALTLIGSVAGIYVAMQVSNEQFLWVFRFLMVLMLFVILIRPERWLRESDPSQRFPLWASVPLFIAIGFYGGFIQMGMGIFFLAVMVLAARYSLAESNVVKITVSALYTLLAVLVFQYNGLVNWPAGLSIAGGQALGGYFTANFASRHPGANIWAHRVLVAVVILSIVQLFGLPGLVAEWLD